MSASALAARVMVDWAAAFPDALRVRRSNGGTGVPAHNPATKLVEGIAAGFIDVMSVTPIADLGAGTAGTPGAAAPVRFGFPASSAAAALFLTSSGWVGVSAPLVANVWVGSLLSRFAETAVILMPPNVGMAAGTSVVSPASNPGLASSLPGQLTRAIVSRLEETGCFCADDIPGGPLTPEMLRWIPSLGAALGMGAASVTAQVTYVGAGGGAPVLGVRNVGGFL